MLSLMLSRVGGVGIHKAFVPGASIAEVHLVVQRRCASACLNRCIYLCPFFELTKPEQIKPQCSLCYLSC